MDSAQAEGAAMAESKALSSAPAADAMGGATSEANAMPASFEVKERSIIRRGDAVFRVDHVKEASSEVLKLVKKHKGFVQSSSEQLSIDNPSMTLEVRIPVKAFDALLADIENVGTLLNRNTNSEDVTMQVVDLEARIKSMMLEEQAYQRILLQAKKIPDVLQVQQRLTEIRGQIESMQAQYKTLREQVAYSTVNITLQQSAAFVSDVQDKGWLGETWAGAVSALKAGGKATMQIVIWLFVMSPFWLVPLLILWFIIRKIAKLMQPKPRTAPPVVPAYEAYTQKEE
jgi:hypothetical protein